MSQLVKVFPTMFAAQGIEEAVKGIPGVNLIIGSALGASVSIGATCVVLTMSIEKTTEIAKNILDFIIEDIDADDDDDA